MSQSTITRRNLVAPSAPQSDAPVQPRRSALWHWLQQAIPTAAVVSVLIGLAVWGHLSDWTLPKFSSLVGGVVSQVEDWCKEHNVPESQCIECNKGLVSLGKDYGWCKEHGIAQCPLDHPDVAQLKTTPNVTAEDFERANRALALRPRAENNSRCTLHERHIQFASIQAMEKVGIDIAVVTQRSIIEAVIANGEVVYDQTHAAHLASRVTGTVWRVEKQVGDRVRKGDVLALIDAGEVGRAKAEFLQAIAQQRLKAVTVERLTPLATEQTVPVRQLREAEAALQESQIRLLSAQQALSNLGLDVRAEDFARMSTEEMAKQIRFLGLPSEMRSNIEQESTTSNLFPLRSPLEGIVVTRNVVPGEVVDASTTIFGVADVRRMWLTLDVRQDDARFLVMGQTVLFHPSDSKDAPEIKGVLAWISTEADSATRTVKVRVDLPNDDGRLRANTFGTGRIVLRDESRAIVVPTEAVHSDGDCTVVFVRDRDFLKEGAPKFFHIRKVRVGVKNGETTEIIAGLLPGEVIASKNSVVLEAQLLKSNLGAGCGCADGH
jgi:membrane fusion protein, heavy metal efflux system